MNNVAKQKGHLLVMILKDKIGNNKFMFTNNILFFLYSPKGHKTMFRKPALEPNNNNNNNDMKTYNIYCIICYMLCDRNNSIVFRVAREYVKKRDIV